MKRTANTGTITYRNGKYEAKVIKYDSLTGHTLYNANGNPMRLSKTFKTKREAETFIADYVVKRTQCKPFSSSDMLFKDWVSIWFDTYSKSGVKPYTLDTAKTVFKVHLLPNLGNIKLSQLTSLHIQKLYSNLDLSAKTIKNIHSFLNKCLSAAVDHGLLLSNPCLRVQVPKVRRPEIKPLNKSDLAGLVKEVSKFETVYDFIIFFTVFTGLRSGEVLGLTWDKIDLSSGKITVDQQLIRTTKHAGGAYHLDRTKSDNSRTFILAPSVLDMLIQYQLFQNQCQYDAGDKWHNDLDLVFTMHDTGKWITEPTLHKHFKRVATKIGRPDLRFHDLRHTFATYAAEAGLSAANLSRVLGHSQTSTTMQYYVHSTDVGDVFCASVTDELIKSIS